MKSSTFLPILVLTLFAAGFHLATPAVADTGCDKELSTSLIAKSHFPSGVQVMWSPDPPDTPPPDYDDPCDHDPDIPGCEFGGGGGAKCECLRRCDREKAARDQLCRWWQLTCKRLSAAEHHACVGKCLSEDPQCA